jgi:hypothetical protein
MKRIRLILLTAIVLLPSMLMAKTVQYLVLTKNNTEVAKLALSDRPVITFSEGNLIVTSGGEQILSTSMDGLRNSFEEVNTGIREVRVDEPARPRFSFGEALFEGLKAGDRVTVYTLDGKVVDYTTATEDGRARLDVSRLGKGIFILRTPSQSIKIRN